MTDISIRDFLQYLKNRGIRTHEVSTQSIYLDMKTGRLYLEIALSDSGYVLITETYNVNGFKIVSSVNFDKRYFYVGNL